MSSLHSADDSRNGCEGHVRFDFEAPADAPGSETDEDAPGPGTEDGDWTDCEGDEFDPKYRDPAALLDPSVVGPDLAAELDGILTVRPPWPGLEGLEDDRWNPDRPEKPWWDGRIPPGMESRSWTKLFGLPRETAAEKLFAAAERGGVRGMTQLGEAFEWGMPVEQDPERAVFWISKAAEKGWIPAVEKLALYHLVGYGGLPEDPAKGVELLRVAVQRNRPLSLLALADCLWNGRGVPADRKEAARHYCWAGYHPRAQFNTLACYARGIVRDDSCRAFHCVRSFVGTIRPRAPVFDWLEGIFHEFGIQIYRNENYAYGCYRLAELGGHTRAKARADAVRARLLAAGETPVEPDPEALLPPSFD